MPIIACGINHKTAPVALREQIIFPFEKIPLYLNDLMTQEKITEAILLSTCNRCELYCVTDDTDKAVDWFVRQHTLPRAQLMPLLYCYQDQAAVEHIMKVACGLDSMVLGESEVLRQMKDTFAESCAAGAVDTLFNKLFQEVFSAAKEIRSATAIGACPVSVASAAVHFIRDNYHSEPLQEATVLLIGAGVTADLTLRYLKNLMPSRIVLANRCVENAAHLAQKYQCGWIGLSELSGLLPAADILISTTGSPTPIVTRSMLAAVPGPLFIVDIAVPRDIDPTAADLKQIQLYSIDDLKEMIQKNLSGREHAAQKAAEMIKEKSQSFMTWLNSLEVVANTIRAYRGQIESLCHEEFQKAARRLERGDAAVEVLESFSYALMNKLLHTPTVQLRQAGQEGRLEFLQLAQQLFAISVP
jgi:glutamyl-tRNA reductase